MAWREALLTTLGPGAFSGITLGDWLRVLSENNYSIDWPYWGRAAAITLGSLSNNVLRHWENLRFARRIRVAKVDPPLFVLGIWRAGTPTCTNLLARMIASPIPPSIKRSTRTRFSTRKQPAPAFS